MTNISPLRAGGHLSPIVPQTIEDVYRLATMAFKSGMLKPLKTGYGADSVVESPDATLARGTMIIMQGMEIGVPPMQSIQLLAMINGRITAHSEAVPGILWARGFKIREWFTGTEMKDDWTAHCELTRPSGEKIEGTYSVADAKKAGLWDQESTKISYGKTKPNDSAWYRFPKRMLKARALGFAGKDGGADALKGIQIRDEADDIEAIRDMRDVTPTTTPALELPEIPEEAPATDTAEARQAIASAISLDMLAHSRDAFPDADWHELEPAYDAKAEELSNR
jgi:hypothetical protein